MTTTSTDIYRLSDKALAKIAGNQSHPLNDEAWEELNARAEQREFETSMGLRDDTPALDAPWWSER